MVRPRKDQTMQAVSLRLPQGILEAVDECAAQLQDQTPLLEVTRTDALRYLIQRGLADFATKGAANSKRKGG